MKKIKHILLVVTLFVFASCDFLDIVPDGIATIEDNAFSMRTTAEQYLFTCYSYMPSDASQSGNPALLGGDEIWLPSQYASANSPKNITQGNQRRNGPFLDFWRGLNSGKNLYRGISDCNIFLENIHRVQDMSKAEKNRWIAEVEFLKVYYHFYLMRMYGPIVIKDKNVSVNAPTEDIKAYRNTLDECFDYVINKLDSIIKLEHLPMIIENEAQELGRVTQGVALTLKAKILVTSASPLFNGNTDYVGLTDKRGVEIFSPIKTEEQKRQRWADAAEACKEAIDFFTFYGRDQLYRFRGVLSAPISDITRSKLSIRMSLTDKWNQEIIWANSNSWTGEYQVRAIPRDISSDRTNNSVQRNVWSVPVKIALMFYSDNGVPITEDKNWNYNDRFKVRTVGSDHTYLLEVGQQTAGINFNRELRYYASIGIDRAIWFGQGTHNETSQAPQARFGERTANVIDHSMNVTGIWPKKLVHYQTALSTGTTGNITQINYPFPIFRLPDLYLMYAEALNESEDSQAKREEAIKWIDIVRERAELKGVAESWRDYSIDPNKPNRQQGLREIIQQETMIEFVFEGHRFWDLRRWKLAMAEYNKPITGWSISYKDAEQYYNENLLFNQKFTPRDYFWPIDDAEILRNANTLQNYGW